MAGKENYEETHESAGKEARTAYQAAEKRFCFDYLRLKQDSVNAGGAFWLRPTFHENAGKSCQTVLNAFKRLCITAKDGPAAQRGRARRDSGSVPQRL